MIKFYEHNKKTDFVTVIKINEELKTVKIVHVYRAITAEILQGS